MAPPVAPPSKPASKKVRNDRCEENRTQKSDQNGDKEKDRILMSDQEDPLASKSEEAKEIEEGNCVSNPELVEDGNLETNPEESKSSPRPHESSSSYSEEMKIRLGNLEVPIETEVLDDFQLRAAKGEETMEQLLSKYVLTKVSDAIKRKAETMSNSRLEDEFQKELQQKIAAPITEKNETLDRMGENINEETIQAGKKEVTFEVTVDEKLEKRNVLKPPIERDFVVTNTGNVATVSVIKSGEKLMGKTI